VLACTYVMSLGVVLAVLISEGVFTREAP